MKGRLNNAMRSRNQYIKIGMIPLITQSRINDYSETTAFTPNGTIGVKIWVSHKKLQPLKKSNNQNTQTKVTLKNF